MPKGLTQFDQKLIRNDLKLIKRSAKAPTSCRGLMFYYRTRDWLKYYLLNNSHRKKNYSENRAGLTSKYIFIEKRTFLRVEYLNRCTSIHSVQLPVWLIYWRFCKRTIKMRFCSFATRTFISILFLCEYFSFPLALRIWKIRIVQMNRWVSLPLLF